MSGLAVFQLAWTLNANSVCTRKVEMALGPAGLGFVRI